VPARTRLASLRCRRLEAGRGRQRGHCSGGLWLLNTRVLLSQRFLRRAVLLLLRAATAGTEGPRGSLGACFGGGVRPIAEPRVRVRAHHLQPWSQPWPPLRSARGRWALRGVLQRWPAVGTRRAFVLARFTDAFLRALSVARSATAVRVRALVGRRVRLPVGEEHAVMEPCATQEERLASVPGSRAKARGHAALQGEQTPRACSRRAPGGAARRPGARPANGHFRLAAPPRCKLPFFPHR
jgi:hypothetical protein